VGMYCVTSITSFRLLYVENRNYETVICLHVSAWAIVCAWA
jgi:hypothetical protein